MDASLLAGLKKGRRGDIARAISIVENDPGGAKEMVAEIFARTGKATIIGITGPAGAGKSTLIDRTTVELRKLGANPAVLAVDPTSHVTGGAILGDRVRMSGSADSGTYIRSVASRGAAGAVARSVRGIARVLEYAGFDPVIVESVGAGQTEVGISSVADITVVVFSPQTGDSIQAVKAGLTEIGDLYVVNKGDLDGASQLHDALLDHVVSPSGGIKASLLAYDQSAIKELNEGLKKSPLVQAINELNKSFKKIIPPGGVLAAYDQSAIKEFNEGLKKSPLVQTINELNKSFKKIIPPGGVLAAYDQSAIKEFNEMLQKISLTRDLDSVRETFEKIIPPGGVLAAYDQSAIKEFNEMLQKISLTRDLDSVRETFENIRQARGVQLTRGQKGGNNKSATDSGVLMAEDTGRKDKGRTRGGSADTSSYSVRTQREDPSVVMVSAKKGKGTADLAMTLLEMMRRVDEGAKDAAEGERLEVELRDIILNIQREWLNCMLDPSSNKSYASYLRRVRAREIDPHEAARRFSARLNRGVGARVGGRRRL